MSRTDLLKGRIDAILRALSDNRREEQKSILLHKIALLARTSIGYLDLALLASLKADGEREAARKLILTEKLNYELVRAELFAVARENERRREALRARLESRRPELTAGSLPPWLLRCPHGRAACGSSPEGSRVHLGLRDEGDARARVRRVAGDEGAGERGASLERSPRAIAHSRRDGGCAQRDRVERGESGERRDRGDGRRRRGRAGRSGGSGHRRRARRYRTWRAGLPDRENGRDDARERERASHSLRRAVAAAAAPWSRRASGRRRSSRAVADSP